MNHEDFKLDCDTTPDNVVAWVDVNYPQFIGLCFFNKDNGILESHDATKAHFYLDPIHRVITVTTVDAQ